MDYRRWAEHGRSLGSSIYPYEDPLFLRASMTSSVEEAFVEHLAQHAQELLFTKLPDWSSEQEYRYAIFDEAREDRFIDAALAAIILGHQFDDANSDLAHAAAPSVGTTGRSEVLPCRAHDTASVTRANDRATPPQDDGHIKQASTVFPGGTAMTSSAARNRNTTIASALSAALALLALLLMPAIGHAQTSTFGIRLDHEPSNSAPGHNCKEDGSDDPTPACTRVAIDMGDAVPGGLTAPMNGTIVKFRVRAGAPGQLTFRLADLRNLGFDPSIGDYLGYGKGVGTGPTVQVAGHGFDEMNPIEEFPAHLKVHKGDYLGIDSTSTSVLYCTGGGNNQLIFSNPLGGSFSSSTQTEGCDLLVQAVMKPAARRHHHRRHH